MVKQWNPEKNCYRSKYGYQTSFKEVLSTKNARRISTFPFTKKGL